MTTVLWVPVLVGGVALALFGSRQTLDAARTLARRAGLSPFIIGMTVVAFGADLPEIANSIAASASGHGDLNVGDSIGSVVTQMTLVLGILCFLGTIRADRKMVAIGGLVTIVSVLVGAMLLDDGFLSRQDGVLLLAFWLVGTFAVQRAGHVVSAEQTELFGRNSWVLLRDLAVGLATVAGGSVMVVVGFTRLAEWFGAPEFATSFLVLALGTSLPELFIDGRAVRAGQTDLAVGGMVGSAFIDATVSLGIGPLLFPVAISDEAARGSLIAALMLVGAFGILLARRTHRRASGLALLAVYAVGYSFIIL